MTPPPSHTPSPDLALATPPEGDFGRAIAFTVRAWAAWSPGLETAADWRAAMGLAPGSGNTAPAQPPLLLRRRVSKLGQQALRAAWSLPESASARMVFCSRHGEFGRTLSILDALAARTEISPADFTLSVHNALAGLLSIARANRASHTAIAAGVESFGFGMLEALACLAERPQEPILLVYFDEPLPAPYDMLEADAQAPIALALLLGIGPVAEFTLATAPRPTTTQADPGAAEQFMRVLLGAQAEAVVVGEQLRWRWRRDGTAD